VSITCDNIAQVKRVPAVVAMSPTRSPPACPKNACMSYVDVVSESVSSSLWIALREEFSLFGHHNSPKELIIKV
jgi:hypothetical protein